jgi:hypothetical protein
MLQLFAARIGPEEARAMGAEEQYPPGARGVSGALAPEGRDHADAARETRWST